MIARLEVFLAARTRGLRAADGGRQGGNRLLAAIAVLARATIAVAARLALTRRLALRRTGFGGWGARLALRTRCALGAGLTFRTA